MGRAWRFMQGYSLLLVIGVSEAASVNAAIVVTKVAVLLVVIAAGALFINTSFWHPFIPPNSGTFGEYGWSGVLRGAGVIFSIFGRYESLADDLATVLDRIGITTAAALPRAKAAHRPAKVSTPISEAVDAVIRREFAWEIEHFGYERPDTIPWT